MKTSHKKRDLVLGMPFGTASNKLRKLVLFSCIQKLGEDNCYRCNKRIESIEELSIEHRTQWFPNAELFWDIGNIAFSHLKCNILDGNLGKSKKPMSHDSNGYRRGCRCANCKLAESNRQKTYNSKRIYRKAER